MHPKSQVVTVASFKTLFHSWSIMWTIQCGYSKCLKRYLTESFQHFLVFWGCCQLMLVPIVFVRNAKKLNKESSDHYTMPAACTEGTTKEQDGMGMGARGAAADQQAASKAST